MLPGGAGAADQTNLGRIGNAGFIVGPAGVLCIDTGTSYAHGRELLAAIRRVSDAPIREVLLTHVRSEFVFGAAAYREHTIPIAMHSRAARLMAARCEVCLEQLRRALGDDAMKRTAVLEPEREFDASYVCAITGRAVQVLYLGHSSGPGDIAVFDETSGVLFAGGLIDHGRIPDIQDAEPEGWCRALEALRALPVRRVVPGHGSAAAPEAIDAVARYVAQLHARARALARAGTSLLEVPDATELPEFSRWDQYETIHRRNAAIAYLRAERELLLK